MNCRKARNHIALLVGDDLSQVEAAELMVHLRVCPECATAHRELSASTDVLALCNDEPVTRDRESLWPDVRTNLMAMDAAPAPSRRMSAGNAMMGLAVAACILFAAMAPDIFRPQRGPTTVLRSLPVSTTGELQSADSVPNLTNDRNYLPVYSNASWQALQHLQTDRGGDFDPRSQKVRRVTGY